MEVKRGEVYLLRLDPVIGSEVGKSRPCVVISPDEANAKAETFIVAPLTTQHRPYPGRVECNFRGRRGQIELDQIRTLSPMRIVSRVGSLDPTELNLALDQLLRMFAP